MDYFDRPELGLSALILDIHLKKTECIHLMLIPILVVLLQEYLKDQFNLEVKF